MITMFLTLLPGFDPASYAHLHFQRDQPRSVLGDLSAPDARHPRTLW